VGRAEKAKACVNALGSRIASLIAAQGPLSIAQFMTMALHDSRDGYYAAREPFGRGGDFITAPEVSQMFGELLGMWIVQCWRDQGSPSPARLVELGPGRGTMMADALRALRIVPEFLAAMDIVLVEASPALIEVQKKTLEKRGAAIRWIDRFDESLMDRPLFLLANEFFDALPIRQFVKTPRGWCERMVAADDAGSLRFALAPVASMLAVPAARGEAQDGAVYEISPASTALVEEIARAIAAHGGAALIVDYGHDGSGFGETLQAVAKHKFAGLLDAPGEADLSAHVDFASLEQAARAGGGEPFGPVEQGVFLTSLGIVQRAQRLSFAKRRLNRGLGEHPELRLQLERLILPEQMGTLFKALAIVPSNAPKPPGF
jgi:NADH dehydrogenase [ubiquinone] 1 alpha subcomplex assembly factor 7